MRFQRLDEWLAWLEQHHPREIELGLARVGTVARRLGLDRPSARVISVAGTNGKGSCVAACAALLGAAGLKVGAYTSPHIRHYSERIQIDGQPVTDAELCRVFAQIDAAAGDTSLTYFEFGTLAALWLFCQSGVDVMVLEVGLGGRLDAVNLLDADIGIVTSVDLDHQQWLGEDRDAIGREKAGIYRPERPALCADPAPPEGLLQAADERGVRPGLLGRHFGYEERDGQWHWWGGADGRSRLSLPSVPPLPGPSLAAALQAVTLLGYRLETLVDKADLAGLVLAGRYERRLWRGRELILDVGHNPAAARLLASRLAREAPRRTLALMAIMADKDAPGLFGPLVPQVDQWWCLSLPTQPRAAGPQVCADTLEELGAKVAGCGTVERALDWLTGASRPGDRLLVTGSFYTVAAVLSAIEGDAEDSEAKR